MAFEIILTVRYSNPSSRFLKEVNRNDKTWFLELNDQDALERTMQILSKQHVLSSYSSTSDDIKGREEEVDLYDKKHSGGKTLLNDDNKTIVWDDIPLEGTIKSQSTNDHIICNRPLKDLLVSYNVVFLSEARVFVRSIGSMLLRQLILDSRGVYHFKGTSETTKKYILKDIMTYIKDGFDLLKNNVWFSWNGQRRKDYIQDSESFYEVGHDLSDDYLFDYDIRSWDNQHMNAKMHEYFYEMEYILREIYCAPPDVDVDQYFIRASDLILFGKTPEALVNLIKNEKWDEVKSRLQTQHGQEEASKTSTCRISSRSDAHSYPIHLGCQRKSLPLAVAAALVTSYPEGVRHATMNGYLPLHYAVCHGCSIGIIKLLLAEYPAGIQHQIKIGGCLPIHLAAQGDNSLEVIDFLHENYPSGIQQQNNQGELPIHSAAMDSSSIEVVDFLHKKYPKGMQQQDKCGNLPIHVAAQMNESIDIVSYVHYKYPDGIQQQNKFGCLPLHKAVQSRGRAKVIRFLLEKYPVGAQQRDKDGHLPIHFAARYNESIQGIDFLHEKYPAGVQQQDNEGNLPIHLAARWNFREEVFIFLREKFPAGLQQKNKCGHTPKD